MSPIPPHSTHDVLLSLALPPTMTTESDQVSPHELPAMQPAVCLAFVKQLWERGGEARLEAIERLRGFVLEPLAVQEP